MTTLYIWYRIKLLDRNLDDITTCIHGDWFIYLDETEAIKRAYELSYVLINDTDVVYVDKCSRFPGDKWEYSTIRIIPAKSQVYWDITHQSL